jgi:hypothetical protein
MWKVTLAMLAASAQSGPQQQFDLSCVGESTVKAWVDGSVSRSDFSVELRIDLVGMQWCEGNCDNVRAIREVLADKIVLDSFGSGERYLDRVSGKYLQSLTVTGSNLSRTADCAVKPFSGFPQTKF